MKRDLLLLAAIAALTTGCATMQPVESPTTYLETNNPEHVRIYSAGSMSVLEAPRLNGTTISGFDLVERTEANIDVARIDRMEVKRLDRQRTTVFVGLMSVIVGAGAYMITQQEDGQGLICDNYQVDSRCVTRNPSKPRVPLGIRIAF